MSWAVAALGIWLFHSVGSYAERPLEQVYGNYSIFNEGNVRVSFPQVKNKSSLVMAPGKSEFVVNAANKCWRERQVPSNADIYRNPWTICSDENIFRGTRGLFGSSDRRLHVRRLPDASDLGFLQHFVGGPPQADCGDSEDGSKQDKNGSGKSNGVARGSYPKGFWFFLLLLGGIPGCLIGIAILYLSSQPNRQSG